MILGQTVVGLNQTEHKCILFRDTFFVLLKNTSYLRRLGGWQSAVV